MPIDTVEELRAHLQLAIEIELTTLPPYLYAMYSIADEASTATKLIRSVAAEEMLHATLMANLLLAVGGEPRFYSPTTIPSYPTSLPHHAPELVINLEPYSKSLLERAFLPIERPVPIGAPAEADQWDSLGQLYHALEQSIVRLDTEVGLFARVQAERQLSDPDGYSVVKFDSSASRGLAVVRDLGTAIAAMEVAIHQGEGLSDTRYADPTHAELTHYAKFDRLARGAVTVAGVLPAIANPTSAGLPAEVRPLAGLFNALYSYQFVLMDRLLAPNTDDRHRLVGVLYGSMVALLAPVARHLMTMPVGDGQVAGPPFEYHQFADIHTAEAELREMAAPIARAHPTLRPALRQLDRLPA